MQQKDNSANKILWINGLKGLACLAVFFHHFVLSFYPASYYGPEYESKTVTGIDTLMSYSPFGVVLNGNFAVCLFIMISAFLYAGKIMRSDIYGGRVNLLEISVKRYLRLMLSIAPVCIINYVLIAVLYPMGLSYGLYNTLSVSELIQHILFYQWITYDSLMIGPLWCMYIIFLGTFIAIFLSMLSGKEKWYMPFVYVLIAGGLYFVNSYYPAVVLGVVLADLFYYERIPQWLSYFKSFKADFIFKEWFRYTIGALIILVGILLGGYPSYVQPETGIYKVMSHILANSAVLHCIGAAVLIAGIMILPKVRFLSSKILSFVGSISFGIYLWHSVVINLLSYNLTNLFSLKTGNYNLGTLITFAITFALIIGLAIVYRYYEKVVGILLAREKRRA